MIIADICLVPRYYLEATLPSLPTTLESVESGKESMSSNDFLEKKIIYMSLDLCHLLVKTFILCHGKLRWCV